MKIGVIDYNIGNIGSICQALIKIGCEPMLIDRAENLILADKLILPGVGSFKESKLALDKEGWTDAILEQVEYRGKSILGVCLGMQLLAESSEEGAANGELVKGLGLIKGKVRKLDNLGCRNRIPHVGWNEVIYKEEKSILFDGIENGTDFYFVHSYAFEFENQETVVAVTNYGIQITAAVSRENIFGTQFHPEKSSKAGIKLLENFCGAL